MYNGACWHWIVAKVIPSLGMLGGSGHTFNKSESFSFLKAASTACLEYTLLAYFLFCFWRAANTVWHSSSLYANLVNNSAIILINLIYYFSHILLNKSIMAKFWLAYFPFLRLINYQNNNLTWQNFTEVDGQQRILHAFQFLHFIFAYSSNFTFCSLISQVDYQYVLPFYWRSSYTKSINLIYVYFLSPLFLILCNWLNYLRVLIAQIHRVRGTKPRQ